MADLGHKEENLLSLYMAKDRNLPPIAPATNTPLDLWYTQSGYLPTLKHGHKIEKKKRKEKKALGCGGGYFVAG